MCPPKSDGQSVTCRGCVRPSDRRRNLQHDRHPDAPVRSHCRLQWHELREREDGQTTTEYAILLGFLAIAIIIALFFLRNVLRELFSDAASSVSNAPGSRKQRCRPSNFDGPGSKCAPARLPPRPGRRIRLRDAVSTVHEPPFRNRRLGGTMSRTTSALQLSPGGGRQTLMDQPTVPIGALKIS